MVLKKSLQKMRNKFIGHIALVAILGTALTGCYDVNQKADPNNLKGNDAGVEYAPQMYHSEPYDPMSQVKDTSAGMSYWPFEKVGSKKEVEGMPHGEWYNTNYWNPYEMNMRQPVQGTAMRGDAFYYWPDSLDGASAEARDYSYKNLENPYFKASGDTVALESDESKSYIAEGKGLYDRFCEHCHGSKGGGDGLVAEKYPGVANLQAIQTPSSGYVYHVITFGKNNMRPHASLIDDYERWKIAEYVINDIVE